MKKMPAKTVLVLGILFFLPVIFLLFLYPSTHNYNPLDIVEEKIYDLEAFESPSEEDIRLENHITILGFLGNNPDQQVIAASNLKELIYDKFRGFKTFQVVIVLPKGSESKAEILHKEINKFEDMRFWHYVYGEPNDIKRIFRSLKTEEALDNDLFTDHIFIVDREQLQRGRIDDREEKEVEKGEAVYPLYSYDCIEVSEIKNKLSDDLRILFTEYRQKRKGKFDSSTRRAGDINVKEDKD